MELVISINLEAGPLRYGNAYYASCQMVKSLNDIVLIEFGEEFV